MTTFVRLDCAFCAGVRLGLARLGDAELEGAKPDDAVLEGLAEHADVTSEGVLCEGVELSGLLLVSTDGAAAHRGSDMADEGCRDGSNAGQEPREMGGQV